MPIKIAELIVSIGAETAEAVAGMNQVDGKMKTTASSGNVLTKALGVAGVAGAVMAVGNFAIDTVSDWSTYSEAMLHAADNAGISTEEMSRLTQAADDFRVEQSSLESAMVMALKNGFTPTIENLATLSDQYLAIEDPAERATLASKIFGRQYADMAPLLLQGGDAIRAATADINGNLIVTEEAAQQNMEYVAQVDNLEDSWTGLKNTLGRAVVPVLGSVLGAVNDGVESIGNYGDAMKAVTQSYKSGSMTLTEYLGAMWDINQASNDSATSGEYYAQVLDDLAVSADKTGLAVDMTAENLIATSIAEATVKNETEKMDAALGMSSGEFNTLFSAAQTFTNLLEQQTSIQDTIDQLELIKGTGGTFDGVQLSAEEVDGKLGELYGTLGDVQAQMQQTTNQMVFNWVAGATDFETATAGDIAGLLDLGINLGIISEESLPALLTSLEESETQAGTTTEITGKLTDALGILDETTVSDKNFSVDMTGEEECKIAIEELNLLTLHDKWATLNYTTHNWPGVGPTNSTEALGGPVYAGESYWVGERGIELFSPQQNGYIIPNSAITERESVVINMNIYPTKEIDEYRLAQRVADVLERR